MGENECKKFREGTAYPAISLNPRDSRRYARRLNQKGYDFVVDKTKPMRIQY